MKFILWIIVSISQINAIDTIEEDNKNQIASTLKKHWLRCLFRSVTILPFDCFSKYLNVIPSRYFLSFSVCQP